jgi:hypothetical protein
VLLNTRHIEIAAEKSAHFERSNRMKKYVLWIASILAIGCFHVPVMAQTADHAALASLEQKWIDMTKAQDVAGLNALLDDNYRADTPGGIQTKADMLKVVPGNYSETLRNLNIVVDGDRGMVSGENHHVRADGGLIRINFVDRFERKNGQWRVISSYVTN